MTAVNAPSSIAATASVEPTPGPWSVVEPVAIDYRAPLIYGADGGSLIACAEGGGPKRAVSGGEARANATLIVRACNLVLAGRALQAAQQAKIAARGDLPPDLDWGLSEGEIAAALMMNALIEKNDKMLAALKLASTVIGEIPSGVLGTQEPAYRALGVVDAAIASVEGPL